MNLVSSSWSPRTLRPDVLHFTTDIQQAVEQALVIFLAVGTPPKADGSPDLSFVEAAARSIADHMNGYKVIVTKSTVPIGTGEHIRKLISERKKTSVKLWRRFKSGVSSRGCRD